MKILLIKPPQNQGMITTSLYEPLDLEYLAASVNRHDVHILDMRIDTDLKSEMHRFNPDLIGLSAYTTDYNNAIRVINQAKEINRNVRVVVGGHHATFMPQDFALPQVDAIFIGYSDTTFPEYVSSFHEWDKIKKVPNLALLENGSLIFTNKQQISTELNSLPLPDRELTARYRMKYHDPVRNRLSLVMTSRGCPFRCTFCACWKLMDGKYASRTPESLIEELISLPKEIGVIYFSDDNTFHDTARMWRLSSLIREYGIRKKFQMYARADTIVKNQSLFRELAASGLKFITIGLESFNDNDLKYYNKKTSVGINNKAIEILKELNIYILAHLMIRPEYSKEDFQNLFEYVERKNLFRPAFPVLTPLPGTELYKEYSDRFLIRDFDYFDFAHSILPTKLAPKDFYGQLAKLYVRSFSIPRIIRHRLCRFLSINRELHYTDNTDGLTVPRLLLISLLTLATAVRLAMFRNTSTGAGKRPAVKASA